MKLLRTSVWISAFTILAPSPLLAQTASAVTPPGWKTYVDKVHGFSFSYPPIYKRIRRPNAGGDADEETEKAAAQGRWVGMRHQRSDARIDFFLENDRFDIDRFYAQHNTSSADGPPSPIKMGDNTYYFCGGGSMGGQYPDAFFGNFKGKTIYIVFDGPYDNGSTPSDETKEIESKMLASFRIL
jgi:hypothetical protein